MPNMINMPNMKRLNVLKYFKRCLLMCAALICVLTIQRMLAAESAPLTVKVFGDSQTQKESFELYLTFSEKIAGLKASDFKVENGKASEAISISDKTHDTHQTPLQGRYYKVTITAEKPGTVKVSLPAGAVTNAGNTKTNSRSNILAINCMADFLPVWRVDSESEWEAIQGASSNLGLKAGYAEPTAEKATFSSKVKGYENVRKANYVTFKQSPVWDHWHAIDPVRPARGGAPIFLPVRKGEYYLIMGAKAYHSTDMKKWSQGKLVVKSKWTTSAEYKDGKFYIIYDKPNDEDPALVIDDDMMDGQIGKQYGTVFHDPSHGSDASLFRNDGDGRFHLIYEEFSPIDPTTSAHDSPLGGHTSSPDGIKGYEAHAHHPVVNHRRRPTGKMAKDPKGREYEIHEPDQDAYGDWTTIKIGQQFYLFADYHKHGAKMSVARFTSDSLYGEFKLVGAFGAKHPDPTVGFAEGKFYVITQTAKDYISPGPWVDGVQARAGVDKDGDNKIDQWTKWQAVKETYDHKSGYARVVERAPARIDMRDLPEGRGFAFEFKVDNSVVKEVAPIMDAVEMVFEY